MQPKILSFPQDCTNSTSFVRVRCYQELGDRLPPSCRGRCFSVRLPSERTLAALLDLLELSREEVDLALINSRTAALSDLVRPGDRVSLYPVFESLDITSVTGLRSVPLRRLSFLADNGLEELAVLLREAGLDALECGGLARSELARRSREEGYVLLTLDHDMILKYNLEKACVLYTSDPRSQCREVLRRFDLE
ncbi:MAG: Mut7-C RNAse domain-containing protein [Desulfohalobiaceae bacterium]